MPENSKIKNRITIAVVLCVVLALDQATKAMLSAYVEPLGGIELVPGLFNIVNVSNSGAAFGMFKGGGPLVLILIAIAALVLIAYLIHISKEWFTVFSLSLIAAGALGNLIDRILFSQVLDFLDFYLGTYHWPAFNVADIAITAGVIFYLVIVFRCGGKGETQEG